MTIPECGKGTKHGAAAEASQYGFAACILSREHGGKCDSGPAEQGSLLDAPQTRTSIEP